MSSHIVFSGRTIEQTIDRCILNIEDNCLFCENNYYLNDDPNLSQFHQLMQQAMGGGDDMMGEGAGDMMMTMMSNGDMMMGNGETPDQCTRKSIDIILPCIVS